MRLGVISAAHSQGRLTRESQRLGAAVSGIDSERNYWRHGQTFAVVETGTGWRLDRRRSALRHFASSVLRLSSRGTDRVFT